MLFSKNIAGNDISYFYFGNEHVVHSASLRLPFETPFMPTDGAGQLRLETSSSVSIWPPPHGLPAAAAATIPAGSQCLRATPGYHPALYPRRANRKHLPSSLSAPAPSRECTNDVTKLYLPGAGP